MANLNIRNLTSENKQAIRVKAARAGKSMESYVRDLALASLETDYYELRVQRGGDREFVATTGEMTQQNAYALWDEWRQDKDVTKLWLSVNGQFDLRFPCPRHDFEIEPIIDGEQKRCKRCRKVLNG